LLFLGHSVAISYNKLLSVSYLLNCTQEVGQESKNLFIFVEKFIVSFLKDKPDVSTHTTLSSRNKIHFGFSMYRTHAISFCRRHSLLASLGLYVSAIHSHSIGRHSIIHQESNSPTKTAQAQRTRSRTRPCGKMQRSSFYAMLCSGRIELAMAMVYITRVGNMDECGDFSAFL
jgi:hypothetical protein